MPVSSRTLPLVIEKYNRLHGSRPLDGKGVRNYAVLYLDDMDWVYPAVDIHLRRGRFDTSIFFQMGKNGGDDAASQYHRFGSNLISRFGAAFPQHTVKIIRLGHGNGVAVRIPQIILDLEEDDTLAAAIITQFDRMLAVAEEVFRGEAGTAFEEAVLSALEENPKSRQKRLRASSANAVPPTKVETTTVTYVRDPYVVAEALYQANGFCGDCTEPGPFLSSRTGKPFLEVHHIVPLSEGGLDVIENAVALCPNCHRKAHFGPDALSGKRETK